MTLAVSPASAAPSRRSIRRGWRSRYPGDFPTLGWVVLDWTYAYLPSPSDDTRAFRFTDEQARRVLRMYELDPVTGGRLRRRVHEEEAKGWGKSPEAGAIALAEFRGPVCFDGWDANGQPVGVPWGIGGRPAPWVQIAAVSEDQTQNTYRSVYGLLTDAHHRAARELKIDEGRTRLYATDMPSAFLERVTASAGSREGQPLSHAVLDEPQLWTPSNGGDQLARTILRNLAKTGGWAHFTGNSPLLGLQSVAETYGGPAAGALHFANRPSETPQQDWPEERKRAALVEVYGDARWIQLERILADIADPAMPWSDSLRFFFNCRIGAREFTWMPLDAWSACIADELVPLPGLPTYACVRIAHDHRSAAVAWAQRQGDRVVLRSRVFASDADEPMDLTPVEAHVADLHRLYPARVMGLRRFSTRRPERPYPMAGPELAYHGAFFERSAQTLKKAGMALVDVPNSQERIAPASEQLMELVLSGKLAHDGDDELTNQMAAVEAEPAIKGWKLKPPATEDIRIEAAIAAMFAVERAMKAPREPSRAVHGMARR